MKKFNYKIELQKVIDAKQLIEVHLEGGRSFKAAYLLDATDTVICFAEILTNATYGGIHVCRMDAVEALKVESIYLQEFSKLITDDSLFQQAKKTIGNATKFNPKELAENLIGSNTLVEFIYDNEDSLCGRVIAYDKKYVLIDEYYAENDHRFARTYLNPASITRICIDGPWTRNIARSLADKNL